MKDLASIQKDNLQAGGETVCYGYRAGFGLLWCPKCKLYHTADGRDVTTEALLASLNEGK
jgi:hypothetical protein